MYRPEYTPRLTPTPVSTASLPVDSAAHAMANAVGSAGAITRTQEPIVTGSSVVAIKYKDGIMMAADTLASYGSMARFRDFQRMFEVNPTTLLGASGEASDYQYIQELLRRWVIEERSYSDGHVITPSNVFEYLSSVMYGRRNKFNPLWNSLVIAGVHEGTSFLGCVDLRGGTYHASTIATGFGAYLAQPILRSRVEGREATLTEEEARTIIEDAMRVLSYRDARTLDRIQIATVTAAGVKISEPFQVSTDWTVGSYVRGYK